MDFAVDYSFSRIVMRTSEFNEDGPDSPTTHYIDIGEDWVAADHFEFRWEMDTTSTAAHPGTDPATDYGVTETATNPFLDPNDNNGFAEDTWHTMSESTASPSLLQWTVEDNTSGGADACKAIFGLVLKIRGVNSGTYYPDSNGITTGTVHCWMRTAYTASGMMG
ncbi:MAG: hypothetical protein GTO49_17175 [Anaerolineae bacterium]|nr:hypothetical protein [Anaerolineae bacterium]